LPFVLKSFYIRFVDVVVVKDSWKRYKMIHECFKWRDGDKRQIIEKYRYTRGADKSLAL
jgi:hypothetical protein